MPQQKTRRRKRDEEEPEQFEEQSEDEEPEEDPEEDFDEDGAQGDLNEVGLRLKEDSVEIDLPRDGNEGKTLHAIADMLDAMA